MANNKQAKVITLIDFIKNDYRNIIPVVLSLSEWGLSCKIIATDKKHKNHPITRAVKNNGIPYGFLESFINIGNRNKLEKITRIYKTKLRNLRNTSNKEKLFPYNNLSLWDNETQDFNSLIGIKRINNILKCGIAFRRMLDTERPDLLIFSDEQSALGKFYALISGEKRIPYLCLPDLGDQLLQNLPIVEFEKTSQYAVLGKGVKNFFRSQGGAAKQFIETGMPLADAYSFVSPRFSCKEILGKLGLKKDKGFFLFTMQDALPENKQILQVLISAMRVFPDKYLIVRPHPAGRNVRAYYSLVRAAGVSNVIISKQFEINDLISASEMVVTIYSLTGLNAIIKGKPLISINLSFFPDNMPYVKYGAALGVYKIEDLLKAMKRVLNNASVRGKLNAGRKSLLRDYPAYNLDTAKNRIRDLVMRQIKK